MDDGSFVHVTTMPLIGKEYQNFQNINHLVEIRPLAVVGIANVVKIIRI